MEIEKELQQLESVIRESERSVEKASGTLEALYDQLKKDHKISTIEDAKKLLEEMKKEQARLDKDIESRFKKIKEEYEW